MRLTQTRLLQLNHASTKSVEEEDDDEEVGTSKSSRRRPKQIYHEDSDSFVSPATSKAVSDDSESTLILTDDNEP